MTTFRRLFMVLLSAVLIAGSGCVAVFAAENDTTVNKDEFGESYSAKYTITVYSGKEGTLSKGTEKSVTANYGDSYRIDINGSIYVNGEAKEDLGFSVTNPKEYYARGLKVAGHDNDETSRVGFTSVTGTVTGDVSYSVAYGIKGGLVKYTVNYRDRSSGNNLIQSEEYYGMPGDYPVVSYQYIEGYAPEVYNLGQTLSQNEADNDFTFWYNTSTLTAAQQAAAAAQPVAGAGGAGAGAAGAGGAGAAGADGTTIGDNTTPLAGAPNVVDLDDGQVPQAQLPEEESSELSRQRIMAMILGGAGAVAIIALIAYLLLKRRREEDDDEYDEDDALAEAEEIYQEMSQQADQDRK